MNALKRLLAILTRTPAYRSWQRYGNARGNLLAGGVTYFSFLSIFPAVTLAFTVFGILLRGHPDWLANVSEYFNKTVPGLINDGTHPNGLVKLTIPSKSTLSITGAVATIGLVLSGLGWLGAMRGGIRAIFGASGDPGNPLLTKLRDLGVMVLFGFGILLSAAVTAVAGAVAGFVAGQIGLGGQGWILTVVGLLLGVVLDGALVALLLRVLSGVDLPWHGIRNGALAGGIGLTLLKVFGSKLLAGTLKNPLYGTIALVVGLLVWLNFIARIVLLSAAWAANDLEDTNQQVQVTEGTLAKAVEGPETLSAARNGAPDRDARAALGLPTFGQRSADRSTLAAGAVLGAAGAAGVGAAARGLLRLVRPSRGR